MNIIQRLIAFLKKIGVLKVTGKVETYTDARQKEYESFDDWALTFAHLRKLVDQLLFLLFRELFNAHLALEGLRLAVAGFHID